MRKFTFVLVAALMAVSAHAQVSLRGAEFERMTNGGFATRLVKDNARPSAAQMKKVAEGKALLKFAAPRKADTDVKLEDAYAVSSHTYIPNNGFVTTTMAPAAFTVSGTKVYFDAFGVGAGIEGNIISGDNLLTKQGIAADSVYFAPDQTLGQNSKGTDIKVSGCTYDNKTGVAKYSATTAITGYYFSDTKELYINSFVGVQVDSLIAAGVDFDCQPKSEIDAYLKKASVDYIDNKGNEKTLSAYAVKFENGYAVKGFDSMFEDSWLKFGYNKSADGKSYDTTGGTVEAFSYLGSGSFYKDKTKTSTYDAYLVLYPCTKGDDGYFHPVSTGLGFTASTDSKTNITKLETDGESLYAALGICPYYADGKGIYYYYNDWSITITDESATAIKGITSNATGKKSEAYFDLLGRRVSKDAKGVLIKRSVAADGTVSAQKIVK